MSDIIRVLPDHVANQIAAGEVVQRPASVVKELLENAIDAGAEFIRLNIKESGRQMVEVIDDGKGMSSTDAILAFERHATSKISSAQDLFQLNTKGFRGEALASIAAVAQVELQTRQEEKDLGVKLKIEGSKITAEPEETLSEKGSRITVKNLFFNIPARRNFLKSNSVELKHITEEFTRVALAHPNLAFEYTHNGQTLYKLQASNLKKRIVQLFGSKFDEKLIPIHEDTEVVQLRGFLGKPEACKKRRGEQYFFVNGRFIKSSYLNHAVNAAYEGLIAKEQFPSFFIFLNIPAEEIDVNIHPTKTEVKFENEQLIYTILKAATKHSLGQFQVSPTLDFELNPELQVDYQTATKEQVEIPGIEVDRNFNPFENIEKPSSKKNTQGSQAYGSALNRQREQKPMDWEQLYHFSDDHKVAESENEQKSIWNDQEAIHTKTIQVNQKYIACPLASGLVIINQNLAHQRILYESFLTQMTLNDSSSQQLLFPSELNFSKSEFIQLKAFKEDLESIGFDLEYDKEEKLWVKGIPAVLTESQISIVLEQLLDDSEQMNLSEGLGSFDVVAKSIAKSTAIKNGTHLKVEEQSHLVDSLFACKESMISPSGKKIYIVLDNTKLDQLF